MCLDPLVLFNAKNSRDQTQPITAMTPLPPETNTQALIRVLKVTGKISVK